MGKALICHWKKSNIFNLYSKLCFYVFIELLELFSSVTISRSLRLHVGLGDMTKQHYFLHWSILITIYSLLMLSNGQIQFNFINQSEVAPCKRSNVLKYLEAIHVFSPCSWKETECKTHQLHLHSDDSLLYVFFPFGFSRRLATSLEAHYHQLLDWSVHTARSVDRATENVACWSPRST